MPHDHLNSCRKVIRQNTTPFCGEKKTIRKLGIEGNILNMIKSIYENSTANIILNGE